MWNSIDVYADENEHVRKYVFTATDAVAEAVLYRYPTYEERTVICCSTMSGCPMGCRFCGAGDYFVRNLTAAEIVAQVKHCVAETGMPPSDIKKLQIMFMSMGEPMLNMKNLSQAITELYELWPTAALLVSTSAPRVHYDEFVALSVKVPTVGLQFSVHESTDAARDKLIPFEKKLTLEQIAATGLAWAEATGRRPFFNYCATATNSSDTDVENLVKLFDNAVWNATVSVVCERNTGMPATNSYQRALATEFAGKLVAAGFDVRVFDPAGQDTIGGGCGQLWFVQDWMKSNPQKARKTCGSGLPVVHIPILQEV